MSKIIGNFNGLFSMHGDISNKTKLQEALEFMSRADELDVNKINDISESGGLYVTDNGTILESFDAIDEKLAKYKIVPTGLKLRFTEYPLFASFIKLNGFWEGAFIGTGSQLFIMYKEHYTSDSWCEEHEKLFSQDNRITDITGFGLRALTGQEAIEYTSEDTGSDVISDLEKAINKAVKQSNNSSTSKSTRAKAAKKADKLRAHLEKIKLNQEKQEAKKKEEQQRLEEANKEDNKDSIDWLEVKPIEDSKETFEDTTSTEIDTKLEHFLNDDNMFCELDNPEDYSETKPFVNKDVADTKEACENASLLLKSMDNDLDYEENETFNNQINNALLQEIYENLLAKEEWLASKRNRLAFYLKGLFIVIEYHRIKNGDLHRGNGYVYSEDNSKCLINTGLLDIYGNYIYLVDHTPKIPEFMEKSVTIMQNKISLMQLGFTLADAKNLPDPARFVENQSELLFNGTIEEFDFEDTEHLYHIIQERINRFPEKFRDEPASILCDRIKNAISRAIKISQTDYRYILPKYDFYRHQIQYLIPFHLETSLDECPELVIVVGKYKGMWEIFTVLYTVDAYDDARLVCNPNNTWIKPKKNK